MIYHLGLEGSDTYSPAVRPPAKKKNGWLERLRPRFWTESAVLIPQATVNGKASESGMSALTVQVIVPHIYFVPRKVLVGHKTQSVT